MKETFKNIEIEGRKFQIHKFDALTGSYIIYTLLTQILPMGLGKGIEGLSDIPANLPEMTKEKFMEIQKDCLRACSEVMPVGNQILPVKVLLPDGRWGVADLEGNAPLVMVLTMQVLGYNAQSFFSENALEMFKNSFAQLSSPNA